MSRTIPEHIRKDPSLANRLRVAVENLKECFCPEKIILFGSYARGTHTEDSTIDILVIADTEIRFVERIRGAIEVTGGTPPVEPLIYTPKEFELMSEMRESFFESALEGSVVLYDNTDGEYTAEL